MKGCLVVFVRGQDQLYLVAMQATSNPLGNLPRTWQLFCNLFAKMYL